MSVRVTIHTHCDSHDNLYGGSTQSEDEKVVLEAALQQTLHPAALQQQLRARLASKLEHQQSGPCR